MNDNLSNQARAKSEAEYQGRTAEDAGTDVGRIRLRSEVADQAAGQCAQAARPAEPVVVTEIQTKAIENFAAVAYHLINKHGKATRAGWNGKGMHVEAQFPDSHSKMGRPYLFIQDAVGVKTPWVPSQGDLFATDWALLPDNHVHYPF